MILYRVSDSISCICYLFNNAIIAAGTTDGSILLFDTLHQYCQLDHISAHKAEITCMKYIEVVFVFFLFHLLENEPSGYN